MWNTAIILMQLEQMFSQKILRDQVKLTANLCPITAKE
jgi:hypothetical protein